MKIKITSDSTCDLPQEVLDKYNITMVPLAVIKDGKQFTDGVDISPSDIFAHVANGGSLCSTAAVNIGEYEELFAKYSKEYDGVIHVNISAEFSSCHQNARLAAENFDNVRVIDSRNLSTGIGLQVLRAAEMAQAGMSAEDIVEEINEARDKVSASFVVDTLTYLARGGRCTAATALVANTLKLHPEIVVRDGKMGVNKKYRGSLDSALLKYAKELQEELLQADPKRVFLTHSGCSQETLDKIYAFLKEWEYFDEIHVTRAGGVISSHCGPGTLGILFYKK